MTETDPETKPTKPVDRFIRQAVLIEIIDGDTLDVQIDLGWSMKLKDCLLYTSPSPRDRQ